jgi:hypothetical protein
VSTLPVRVSTTVEPRGINGAPVAGFTMAREGPVTSSFATSSGSTRGAGGKGSVGEGIEGNGSIAARAGRCALPALQQSRQLAPRGLALGGARLLRVDLGLELPHPRRLVGGRRPGLGRAGCRGRGRGRGAEGEQQPRGEDGSAT